MTQQRKNKTVRTSLIKKLRAVFDLLRSSISAEKVISWILVITLFILGVLAIQFAYKNGEDGESGSLVIDNHKNNSEIEVDVRKRLIDYHHSSIDGSELFDENNYYSYYAVMIDNISSARPGSSVSKARLVFEAPVEGGITRLMIVLDSKENLERIGPVRSARPYFIDWAKEYGFEFVHVGGSPEAIQMLLVSNILDVNEMYMGGYFWRDRNRYAPHNVYTSSELLGLAQQRLSKENHYKLEEVNRPFIKIEPANRLTDAIHNEIKIDYSVPAYYVTWDYDGEVGQYNRYQGSGQVKDEDGSVVSADNVIIQFTDIKVIDSIGRKSIRTSGQGRALVFQAGQVYEAEWVKDNNQSRTKFVDVNTKIEIPLLVGKTWIQVVAEDTEIEY